VNPQQGCHRSPRAVSTPAGAIRHWVDATAERLETARPFTEPRGRRRWAEASQWATWYALERFNESVGPNRPAELPTRQWRPERGAEFRLSPSAEEAARGPHTSTCSLLSADFYGIIATDLGLSAAAFAPERYSMIIEGRPVQVFPVKTTACFSKSYVLSQVTAWGRGQAVTHLCIKVTTWASVFRCTQKCKRVGIHLVTCKSIFRNAIFGLEV